MATSGLTMLSRLARRRDISLRTSAASVLALSAHQGSLASPDGCPSKSQSFTLVSGGCAWPRGRSFGDGGHSSSRSAVVLSFASGRLAFGQVDLCGAPSNPYGYTFCSDAGGTTITNPPSDFCSNLPCIGSAPDHDTFWAGRGHVIECQDGDFSKSGGIQGSCSSHGGNNRTLYAVAAQATTAPTATPTTGGGGTTTTPAPTAAPTPAPTPAPVATAVPQLGNTGFGDRPHGDERLVVDGDRCRAHVVDRLDLAAPTVHRLAFL